MKRNIWGIGLVLVLMVALFVGAVGIMGTPPVVAEAPLADSEIVALAAVPVADEAAEVESVALLTSALVITILFVVVAAVAVNKRDDLLFLWYLIKDTGDGAVMKCPS